MGAPKQKWTPEEEAALKSGVKKHGAGKWRTILKDPDYSDVLFLRSNVDLKDKWRNMSVIANGWGTRDKARLAFRRSLQDENSMCLSTVLQSDEDIVDVKPLAITDSAMQIDGPKRTNMRLDNLILEAITSLEEPGGSNKTTIATYIEEQYWAPPNLKRVLSSKLKFLIQSGKLVKVKRKYRIAGGGEKRTAPLIAVTGLMEGEKERVGGSRMDEEGFSMPRQSEMNLELSKMKSMSPKEAAAVAARAVAEAEAAIAEAEEAARQAEAAEADAEAATAFAEAAKKTLQAKTAPKMMIRV